MLKKILPVIIVIVLGYFTVRPLFDAGFFPVHDNVSVERVYEMAKALKDGQFPVRWVKDLGYGYGYPIFNFYAPLPYYVGGFMNLLGIDVVIATKLMFLLGIITAGVTMYLLAGKLWGTLGGIVSAVLYLYAPYHALDIYVRGAVSEFFAVAFIPLVFLGFYKISLKEEKEGILIGSLGLVGVVLSHNLTAFMLIPFIIIYLLILAANSSFNIKLLLNFAYLIITALALSCFFWLPAIFEMKYTNVFSQIGGGADFRNHFIFLDQLWDFPWGFGGSAGKESGISFKIGKPNIVLWILSIVFFLYNYEKNKKYKTIMMISIVGFLLAVFMTNKASLYFWNSFSPMAFIQYPWRFILLSVFFSSLAAGFCIEKFRLLLDKFFIPATYVFVVLVIFFHSKYFIPQYYTSLSSSSYTETSHLRWEASKISDEYLPKDFSTPKYKEDLNTSRVISGNNTSVQQIVNKTQIETFLVDNKDYATITIQTAKFPGWKVYVDQKNILLSDTKFLTFTIPSGKHEVTAKFENTPVRSLANLISLLGFIFFGVILLKLKYAKNT